MNRHRSNRNGNAGHARRGMEALEGRTMFNVVPLLAPKVISAEFDDARAPHELRVRFTEDVSASLDHNDITLINDRSRLPFPTERLTINWDAATNTAHFVFVGAEGGVLDEGTWHATLISEGIFGPDEYVLDGDGDELPGGDHLFQFSYNAADITRDGAVNLLDFNVLSANFGLSGATRGEGDLNYDGRVDLADFRMLAERFSYDTDPPMGPAGTIELWHHKWSSPAKASSSPSQLVELVK